MIWAADTLSAPIFAFKFNAMIRPIAGKGFPLSRSFGIAALLVLNNIFLPKTNSE